MPKEYQVVIVGSGPSAIFAAFTLTINGVKDIAIFEKGKDILFETHSAETFSHIRD
jgi:thioredoxin reductase